MCAAQAFLDEQWETLAVSGQNPLPPFHPVKRGSEAAHETLNTANVTPVANAPEDADAIKRVDDVPGHVDVPAWLAV